MTDVARNLNSIAADIRKHHGKVEAAASDMLEHACAAGQVLVEAKEQVEQQEGYGNWKAWLEREAPSLSMRTAQLYMQIADNWDQIEAEAQSIAHLGIGGAQKLISKPKPTAGAQDGQSRGSEPGKSATTGSQGGSTGSAHTEPLESAPSASSPDDTAPQGEGDQGEAESEPEADPDSLEAVQADLKDLEKQGRALVREVRRVMGFKGNTPERPYCGRYSKLAVITPIEQVCRAITNEMPVSGDPDDPVVYREQKAEEASK